VPEGDESKRGVRAFQQDFGREKKEKGGEEETGHRYGSIITLLSLYFSWERKKKEKRVEESEESKREYAAFSVVIISLGKGRGEKGGK